MPRQFCAAKKVAGKDARRAAMEQELGRRQRPATREELQKAEKKRRVEACAEGGRMLALGMFLDAGQVCRHFNLDSDCRRLINYHKQQLVTSGEHLSYEDNVASFEQCSVPQCQEAGCPCCGAEGAEADDGANAPEMSDAAWQYGRSMFTDKNLSAADIADLVFKEYGVERSRQMWLRWRSRNQKSLPENGRPTKLPAQAEGKLVEAIIWLRQNRIHVAPMHVAMLAHNFSQKAGAIAQCEAPSGFTRKWVGGFLKRQEKHLGLATAETIEDLRAFACTPKQLGRYFSCLQEALLELGWATPNPEFDPSVSYDPKNKTNTKCAPIIIDALKVHRIVSMDETRFTLNQAKEGKLAAGTKKTVVIKAESATGEARDWGEVSMNKSDCDCTIVGGSTAGYMALPALYIFKGAFNPITDLRDGPVTRRADGTVVNCYGTHNEKGSMTDDIMIEWLEKCLCPMFPDLSPENPILLICDGYGCHLYLAFLKKARELGVRIILRPPHSSHVTQGEDVQGGHFHTFHFHERKEKMALKSKLLLTPRRNAQNMRSSQLLRSDIMAITKKAWMEAFAHGICVHAWQAIGIWPIFNRRPLWDMRKREVQHQTGDRDRIADAVEGMAPQDIALAAFGSDDSSDEERRARKRITDSSRWFGKGVINFGTAWEERQAAESERAEQEQQKEKARQDRQDAQGKRRADDAAAGSAVHNNLVQGMQHAQTLSKKEMKQLLTFWGQKPPADNKPAGDFHSALVAFLQTRPDLPYSANAVVHSAPPAALPQDAQTLPAT